MSNTERASKIVAEIAEIERELAAMPTKEKRQAKEDRGRGQCGHKGDQGIHLQVRETAEVPVRLLISGCGLKLLEQWSV